MVPSHSGIPCHHAISLAVTCRGNLCHDDGMSHICVSLCATWKRKRRRRWSGRRDATFSSCYAVPIQSPLKTEGDLGLQLLFVLLQTEFCHMSNELTLQIMSVSEQSWALTDAAGSSSQPQKSGKENWLLRMEMIDITTLRYQTGKWWGFT